MAVLALVCLAPLACDLSAQTCTTQARMTPQQRSELGSAAFALARAVLASDAPAVQARTVSNYAGDPNQTADLVRSTGQRLTGDHLAVTQAYLLDASGRAGNGGDADFACALAGSGAETDFSISGLPVGRFAFVSVRAAGPHPYVMAFLLQSEAGVWKMAGYYPHATTAAGHDGLWYWTEARADAKQNRPWLAWLRYGLADQLLRPAVFVSSTNLDKLTAEQRSAAPEPLSNGLSQGTPLTLQGSGGAVFRVTSLALQPTEDGASLNLVMHRDGESTRQDNASITERNLSAARTLLQAHPEVAAGVTTVLISADRTEGGSPVVTARPLADLQPVTK